MDPVTIGLAGAALGGAAGGQADVNSSVSGIRMAPASQLERQAGGIIGQNLGQLQEGVNAGPGIDAVSGGLAASNSLAEMLKKYAAGGFLPGKEDMATANQFAQSAFNPQAVALKQNFAGQQQRAAQLAAQLGRPVNDPIIQAKLSQEYMQGQERLGAQQGAYSSAMALQLPQQRLGYTSQLADVRNNLASQAMANRQALLSLGSQVQGSERQFRLQSGEQYGQQTSGGGMKGALIGAIGGFGAGIGAGGMLGQQGLQQAQTGYYNSMANAASQPGFGMQQAPTFNFSNYAQPAIPQRSLSAPPTLNPAPIALQPNNSLNSFPLSNPQFNIFGQMSSGGY